MGDIGGRVLNSLISKLGEINKQKKLHFDEEYEDEDMEEEKSVGQVSTSSKHEYLYKFPSGSDDFIDGGNDSNDEAVAALQPVRNNMPPEVNLKNVLAGLFAIVTGQNKVPGASVNQQYPSSNVSFLGSGKNGDTYLHSSVYIPSAPPLLEPNYSAYKEAYEPLFEYFPEFSDVAFRVDADNYVTADSGTGVVHCAPAFGEDDYRFCIENQIINKEIRSRRRRSERRTRVLVCLAGASGKTGQEITCWLSIIK